MYRYFYRYSRSADRRRGWARGLAVHKESPVPPGFFLFPPTGRWTWHNFYSPNGGIFLGQSQSRAPSPAKRVSSSFLLAFGGEKSPIGDSQYGSPPGRSFYSCKRNQNTLGALPQDPCRWLCWIWIDFRREPKINPYCAQNRSQGSHGRICPFPPPPFPMAGKGPGWAGKCRAAVYRSGC